ncbi:MAG TPA: DUF494 domain-containing protein [Gammaproteobacteria bacterium]|nr:DUF494 domain-containing protein [Gammaproteobacteria bacterium]
MKENMLDVLLYLFEHCVDEDLSVEPDEDTLRHRLSEAGFEDTEIRKAFSWLETLARHNEDGGGDDLPQPGRPASLRIYTQDEMDRIGPRSRALILFLERMDILRPATRELVIDRIMALETEEMDLEGVRWVILMVLFNQPGNESSYGWMEDVILNGHSQRERLH